MRAIASIGLVLVILISPHAAGAKEPRSVDLTTKSVGELAGCIALELAEYSGYEIRKTLVGSDTEIRMKFRVAGISATAATFLIKDMGTNRQLTIFATGKGTGAPRVISENARRCATE